MGKVYDFRPLVDGVDLDQQRERLGRQFKESENGFKSLFVETLSENKVLDLYDWPPILDIRTEYRLSNSIFDVVAFHADGSITVFELKKDGLTRRDYLTGIGQLMHASVLFGASFAAQDIRRKVRLVLAVASGVDRAVGFACMAAGIEYMPFGTVEEHNAAIASVADEYFGADDGETPDQG